MNNQLTNGSSRRTYYPALDGIRGVAILLVVFFHNFNFVSYFAFGWLGVDLFFVLSGFLISNILITTLDQKHSLRNFYIKRILRIFPLYYSVLIFVLIILPGFFSFKDELQFYLNNQWWFWCCLQNWLFVLKIPEQTNILLHFWSLAVEEQFYLIWPITMLIIRKPKPLLLLLAILLAAILILRIAIWHLHVEHLSYFSLYTFTRIDGICIGCMLALIMELDKDFLRRNLTAIVGVLTALNFSFFFLNRANAFTFPFFAFVGYTTIALLFALLVYEIVLEQNKIINSIFSNKLLIFFGRLSFGFYIFHWPIYVALNPNLVSFFTFKINITPFTSQLLSSLICTSAGLCISVISYYYFEMYFLKLKARFH
jgi:peptidoglycan/LPS O-acetylase OafA/YrhL